MIDKSIKDPKYIDILNTVVKQSAWIFVGKIVFIIVGFAASALLARILGPSSLGRYQLGLTVIQIATVFSVLGFDKGLVRYLPILLKDNLSAARSLFLLNTKISLALAVALSTTIFFISPVLSKIYFRSEEMTETLKIFSIYLPVLTLFNVSSGGVTGIKRADMVSNINNVLTPIFFLGFLIILYFNGPSLANCVLVRSASHFIGFVFLFYFLQNNFSVSSPSPKHNINLREYFSYSSSLMFIGLVYFLLGQMDILMLGYFVADSEVGVYFVSLRIAVFVVFGLQVVLPIVAPIFSELFDRKQLKTIEMIFKTITKWLVFTGLFIFSIVFILRIELLSIFGNEFLGGKIALIILCIGHLANVMSGPTGQLLIMTDKQRWETINIILMAVINFFLNLLLIPRMGISGAAVATAISIFSINIAKFFQVFLIYKIHPYSMKCIKGIVAVLVGGVASFYVRDAAVSMNLNIMFIILISSLTFATLTFGFIYFFGLDDEDKLLISMIRNR